MWSKPLKFIIWCALVWLTMYNSAKCWCGTGGAVWRGTGLTNDTAVSTQAFNVAFDETLSMSCIIQLQVTKPETLFNSSSTKLTHMQLKILKIESRNAMKNTAPLGRLIRSALLTEDLLGGSSPPPPKKKHSILCIVQLRSSLIAAQCWCTYHEPLAVTKN